VSAAVWENPAIERLHQTALRPLYQTSRLWWVWIGFLAALVGLALFAYASQLRGGLAVTGMNNEVVWGFYIVNFVFFIGISHAGTLISAILRVCQAGWRRPITRMAEVITGIALMVGALMPIIDLGRPERALNVLLHGQMGSPILWDFISISTYLTGSLIYLYLPMIPDLALARDRLRGQVSPLRWRLYSVLALGWRDTPRQRQRLERALSVMMIIIIPIAISVHTVVSWIFAMTMRAGWDSTIFGPYFVVGAIFSGVAGIITVMYVFRRAYRLQEYITEKHFRYLGYLLLALAAIYTYFTIAEYITIGYKLEGGDGPLLDQLMLGQYAVPFWIFVVAGLVLPIVLIAVPRTCTIPGIVIASVLVNLAMWLKRFVIVIPSLALPLMPYEWGVYRPTWVEISITAGAIALFALLFTLFAKLFPIVSIWEIQEDFEPHGGLEAGEPASARPGGAFPVPALAAEGGGDD
jgi:Ni/Fe-hydrogenase subunit HybB-like protein